MQHSHPAVRLLKTLLHPPPPVPFTLPASPLQPPFPTPPQLQPASAVPHTRQGSNWDCGLACVLSVLAHYAVPSSLPALRGQLTSDSVWTVDLLALLDAHHMAASLYTTYAGANPTHAAKHFYTTQWTADSRRIEQLFARYQHPATATATATASSRVQVQHASLSSNDLYSHVEHGNLLLLLVDPRYLHCPHCHTHQSTALSSHFTGHFILITRIERRAAGGGGVAGSGGFGFGRRSGGVERSEVGAAAVGGGVGVRLVWYMDPASDGCTECVCSESWIEQARKSDGTDEDCIVILGRDEQPTLTNGHAAATVDEAKQPTPGSVDTDT